jgi:HlyD family secretion protein
MAKIIKFLVAGMILAALALGGYSWLQGREPSDGGLKTVTVEMGSITEKAIAVGQIEPRVKFHVKSKIPGIVRRCTVEIGDRVKSGDALFEIIPDPTPTELVEAQSRVDAARTGWNRAEANWNRASALAQQGIIASEQLDADRETFELARIELDRAEQGLQLIREGRASSGGRTMESIIRAPAGGIVLARAVDPGDPVVPLTSFQDGTELATIADMSDLVFNGTVDEIDVGKLHLGVEARLKIGALPGQEVVGRLTRIAPQATEKDGARLFEVEIELEPAAEIVLRAGYSANADLIIREKNDVLVIPERLVKFEEEGARKFVETPAAEPGGEPRKVEIETGLSDGLSIEVVSGLSKGDLLVERPPRGVLG